MNVRQLTNGVFIELTATEENTLASEVYEVLLEIDEERWRSVYPVFWDFAQQLLDTKVRKAGYYVKDEEAITLFKPEEEV